MYLFDRLPKSLLIGLLFVLGAAWLSSLYAQTFRPLPLIDGEELTDYGNGVAFADYNQDGYLDLYLVAIAPFDPANPKSWNRLLRGTPVGFKDVTLAAGLTPQYNGATLGGENGVKTGVSWGDYDNDGFPDLLLTNQGKDQLYHNEGNGTFREVTESAGIKECKSCYGTSALWWDYDQDGFLDVYLNDWSTTNRLYHNQGDGTFSEVGKQTGLAESGHSFTSLPFDIDKDGDPDLYVVNDFGPNVFYLNLGNGQFEPQTGGWGLSDPGEGMGADICDCNHDGNFDLYLTNIWRNHPNPFFLAGPDNVFAEKAQYFGLGDAGWGWGARFFDLENDGDEDLYVVNQEKWIENTPDFNRLFVAETDYFWESAQQYGLNSFEEGHGLETFDFNLDGDLDLVVTNWGAPPVLYQNNLEKTGNWLQLTLEGTVSNRNAFGAVVKVLSGGKTQHRLHHGANFLGQSIKPLHFGLGAEDHIDELIIFWPSGRIERVEDLAANQFLFFREGEQPEVFGLSYGTSALSTPVQDAREAENSGSVGLYPNPFHGKVRIEIALPKPEAADMSIYDAQGQKVHRETIGPAGETTIINWTPGPELPAGIYFLEIRTDRQVIRRRMIKN